jgi:DNA end-binding protein Ku
MRPLWKGTINFGLVTIPVRLYTAVEQKDIRFRLLHRDDGAPIVEKRFCTAEDKEVAWEDLVRGFEVAKGEYVIVDPKEIEEVEPESAHTVEIGDFVELEEIDPIYFEKSYFLEPDSTGAKAYVLLREALEETRRVAVAKVTIRTKERLATVRPYEETLLLETMYWPDEIRSTDALEVSERASPGSRELKMARQLVESLSAKFDPSAYEDRYRIALQELIEQKTRGEVRNAKRRKPPAKVIDLMAALEASLAEERESGTRSRARTAAERSGSASSRGADAGSGRKAGGKATAGTKASATPAKATARRRRSAA